MANWCSNTVAFTGKQSQLKKLKTLFTQMAEKEKAERKGQIPHFIKEDKDWLFEISWDFDTLYYETKWSPNIELIQEVATHYGVGFVYGYSETANGIFGEAIFENGVLQDTYLENSDFDQYEYVEETNAYTFENEVYESDLDILEILLERKKGERL